MTFLFLLHSPVPFKTNFPIAAHEFRYASQMTALDAGLSLHTLPSTMVDEAFTRTRPPSTTTAKFLQLRHQDPAQDLKTGNLKESLDHTTTVRFNKLWTATSLAYPLHGHNLRIAILEK